MTEEELTVLAIKGAITELPPAEREQCEAMVEHLRRMVADAGSPVGTLAIALIGAELQLEGVNA
jgi:hypothetical protein